MKTQLSSLKLDPVSRFISTIIFIIGMTLTYAFVFFVHHKRVHEDNLRLEYESKAIVRRVQAWLDRYEGALIQTRAFILNAAPITRKKFQEYVRDTEIFTRYPGLQGIGYSSLVMPSEVKEHTREMKNEFPDYALWPGGAREKYYPIVTLEPQNILNRRAIGYDMYSDLIRKQAMDAAIKNNTAIRSRKVRLVQEEPNKDLPGFNLYLPLYLKNSDTSNQVNRQKNIIGFIYSPFRTGKLFDAILKDLNLNVDVKIYEDRGVDPDNQIYDSNISAEQSNKMKYVHEIILNGLPLTFVFSPRPNFSRQDSIYFLVGIFLLGMVLTVSTFLYYTNSKRRLLLAKIKSIKKNKQLAKEKLHVEVRDDFLSIASHELKTPVTSLNLHAQLVQRQIVKTDSDTVPKDKVLALIDSIHNQTTRIIRLVDDMLDTSRLRVGNLKMENTDSNLQHIINDVVEKLSPQFMTEIGERPKVICEENITGHWDPFRIEQVITNLLTNALRYGNNKPVTIKCMKTQQYARIEVIDQGMGVSPEDREKIFDRFQRAQSTENEAKGLGLGLYITQQIILAHGGRIEVQSEINKGSTFIVFLPITED